MEGKNRKMNLKKLDYLGNLLERSIQEEKIVGASILVSHEGKEVFRGNYGYGSRENQIPIKNDTIFRLFSMTKPITAVAAMILYERGQLDLLTPVSEYIPAFGSMKVWTKDGLVDAKGPIMINQLLNMTSGLVYPDANDPVGREMALKMREVFGRVLDGEQPDMMKVCEGIAQVPLAFHPGEDWRYGASADVLGAVIEVITGKRLGEFYQEEIFGPLGMEDTKFYVPEENAVRFADMYTFDSHMGKRVPTPKDDLVEMGFFDFFHSPSYELAGGGLFGTIEDYVKFAQFLLDGGEQAGVKILGRKTLEYFQENQLSSEQMKSFQWESIVGYGYGNLMRVLINRPQAASNGTIGEFGWDGLAGTYFFVDTKEKLIVVYMQQNREGADQTIRRGIRSIVYGGLD